ncbi:hypothetical protein [Natrialba chahannaoensis]|uniref:hypothetical protein n=1 Tax=Natrialba chahannaoensis TaxID=68911 RepID=UPI000B23C1B9|nr:hypothetical protein [Natrialba chahannaoensis]
MPAEDRPSDARTAAEPPSVPSTIVADIDHTGCVTIYDERTERAWIRSTVSISLPRAV